jgi:glycosyltransferase involved in cell wall biosynthesis
MKENKLVYFLSHPIQYISPLLQELAKELDLEVYYYSDISVRGGFDKGFGKAIKWDTPLLDGYKSEFLRNFSNNNSMNLKIGDAINPGVLKVLWKSKSKVVVVNSWTYFSDLLVIFTAWIFGKKVWLRAENPLHKELVQSNLKQVIKKIILKHFLFRFFINKFLYIGTESMKNFIHFGASETNLIYTPYCVDNLKFQKTYTELRQNKTLIKEQFNLPLDKKIILFCGKYISVKRPLDLVDAFNKLNFKNTTLVLVGEGELRVEIQDFIVKNSVKDVVLTGFVNQSEIVKYYAIADLFVLCSEMETWGLAVNEAMNFNIPCVVSDNCGCSKDLILEGINGYTYKTGDITELSSKMEKVLNTDIENFQFDIINKFSIEMNVKNICTNLNYKI